MTKQVFTVFLLGFILLMSCQKDEEIILDDLNGDDPEIEKVTVNFHLHQKIDGDELELNDQIYATPFGNVYEVTRLRYILSEFTFRTLEGQLVKFDDFFHFIDVENENHQSFTLEIPKRNYNRIQFIFGLKGENNQSGIHPTLNAAGWSWPDPIGGGYHFMQLDGFFVDDQSEDETYNIHLGNSFSEPDQQGLSENYQPFSFDRELYLEITGNEVVHVHITMHINNWYKTPNEIDLNDYSGGIMGNHNAQVTFHENGHDVFSLDIE